MKAKVRIDVEQVTAKVNPMIFGQFIENMGRAIYGGVYEPGNPLSDKDGFRLDVIEKIKELNTPILRWPGGNFSSGYHWMDGIGPKDKRPKRQELAWQTTESNQFGTHEFMELCKRIGTDPYLCVNLGWGTSEEAVNWLEYCNSEDDTHFADLRRQNGMEKPFDVKYWGLGNEIYGTWQHGHCEPREYAHKAAETAKMMSRLDPSIKFIFCGANQFDWDREVLEYLYQKGYAPLVDYISLHRYDGCSTYYGSLFSTNLFEQDIVACKGLISEIQKHYQPAKLPMIAFDEWNVWYRKNCDRALFRKYFREGEDLLDEFYNLRDALYVGSALNIFIRHADRVGMANMAQLVNVIAPIFATPKGSYLQPIFFPLKFYRQMHKDYALDVNIETESLTITRELEEEQRGKYADEVPEWRKTDKPIFWNDHWYGRKLAFIDVAATRSKDGKEVVISMVNRHETDAIEVEIDLFDYKPSSGRQVLITGPDPMGYSLKASGLSIADNDYDEEACTAKESQLSKPAGKFTVEIPAHSILIVSMC